MTIKKTLHRYSGLLLAVFVAMHLGNHLAVLISPETHIWLMNTLRLFYRNVLIESILLLVVLFQVVTGIQLLRAKGLRQKGWSKWQIWSGLYMAYFFLQHVGAVMFGRFVLHTDTNLYFGAAGLNAFPLCLFFVPYYSLGIVSFFTHIASIHAQKSNSQNADNQAKMIVIVGVFCAVLILLGMTDFLKGLPATPSLKAMVSLAKN